MEKGLGLGIPLCALSWGGRASWDFTQVVADSLISCLLEVPGGCVEGFGREGRVDGGRAVAWLLVDEAVLLLLTWLGPALCISLLPVTVPASP